MDKERIRRLVAEILSEAVDGNMSDPIPVEVSGRHVHLSPEDFEFLAGREAVLEKVRYLSQPGQFLSGTRVRLIGPKGILDRVAVLGPLRNRTQVEISATDAAALGICPPVRASGNLAGAAGMHLQNGERVLSVPECAIVAARHLHMTPGDARRFGVQDGQKLNILLEGTRPLALGEVLVRVSAAAALALHIDFDEANAAGIRSGGVCRILGGSARPSIPEDTQLRTPAAETGKIIEFRQEGKNPILITEEIVRDASRQQAAVIQTTGRTVVTPQAWDALSARGIKMDMR